MGAGTGKHAGVKEDSAMMFLAIYSSVNKRMLVDGVCSANEPNLGLGIHDTVDMLEVNGVG